MSTFYLATGRARRTLFLLSFCASASLLSSEVVANNYETRLLEAARLATEGQSREAVNALDQLLVDYPQSRVGHSLRAELLFRLTGRSLSVTTEKSPSIQQALKPLNEELGLRWRHVNKAHAEVETILPSNLLKPSVKSPFAIYVDLPAARLYVFDTRDPTPTALISFYVTIGREGYGKQKEGDLKTPVGVYRLTGYKPGKKLHERYGYGALTTDYPNALDKSLKRTGYGIWIHGTEPGWENRGPRASDGCITLSNTDFETLVTRFPMGKDTPVIIDDAPQWMSATTLNQLRHELESSLPLESGEEQLEKGSDLPGVPHAWPQSPLAAFQEIYQYPASRATLITRRLLPETGDHAIAIDEYWTQNASGTWERMPFKP